MTETTNDQKESLREELFSFIASMTDIEYGLHEDDINRVCNLFEQKLAEARIKALDDFDYYAQRNIECSIYEDEVCPLIDQLKQKYNPKGGEDE